MRKIRVAVVFMLLVFSFALIFAGKYDKKLHDAQCPPDYIHAHGSKLYLGTAEYREIGLNFYQAFRLYMNRGWDGYPRGRGRDHAKACLRDISEHDFRLVRIMLAFSAGEYGEIFFDANPKIQDAKRGDFFASLDGFFDDCDRLGIRVVVSLFWHIGALGDLGSPSNDAVANGNSGFLKNVISKNDSPAYQKFAEFRDVLVGRYKNRPTVAMWEIGNEYDLDMVRQYHDGSAVLARFFEHHIQMIKSVDPNHLVTTGNSEEAFWYVENRHPSAWNPVAPSLLEHRRRIISHHAASDVVSVHAYIQKSAPLAWYQDVAGSIGKPLMIGEIGPYFKDKGRDYVHADYNEPRSLELVKSRTDEIVRSGASAALYWNYNCRPEGEPDFKLCYGMTDRALKIIEDGNGKMKKRHK